MNGKTETRALHWDVAAGLVVVVAAMYFFPQLRTLLFWPALALVAVLASLMVFILFQPKEPKVTYTFTPPSTAPVATGATEMIRKTLADKVITLDWMPFEQLVTGLYTTLGYIVKRSGGPLVDNGVDLLLVKDKTKTLVQCKHWKPLEVQEMELKDLLATLVREKIENGIFVTPREISPGARRFAAMNSVLLVGAKDLVRMLEGADWEKNPMIKSALDQSRKLCPCCQSEMTVKDVESGPNFGKRVWVCKGEPKCTYSAPA